MDLIVGTGWPTLEYVARRILFFSIYVAVFVAAYYLYFICVCTGVSTSVAFPFFIFDSIVLSNWIGVVR